MLTVPGSSEMPRAARRNSVDKRQDVSQLHLKKINAANAESIAKVPQTQLLALSQEIQPVVVQLRAVQNERGLLIVRNSELEVRLAAVCRGKGLWKHW